MEIYFVQFASLVFTDSFKKQRIKNLFLSAQPASSAFLPKQLQIFYNELGIDFIKNVCEKEVFGVKSLKLQ
jgi:predicted HD phosphohydrolase